MEVKAVLTSSLGRTILGSSVLTIGRASDNGLVASEPTISSHHAEIRLDERGYSIVDLGSKNGTFVNGQRLTKSIPHLLHSGDTFRIGSFTFTFTYEEEYPTALKANTNALPTIAASDAWSSPNLHADRDLYSAWAGDRDDEEDDIARSSPPFYDDPNIQRGASSFIPESNYSVQSPMPSMNGEPLSPPLIQIEPRNLAEEHLQFTAFYPRDVPVETWQTLLFYAYVESALEAIHADASKFRSQLGPHPFQADAWAPDPLPRGTQITVVPYFPGVTFNPEVIPFAWVKDWHPAIFYFNADKRWTGAVGRGKITVFAGPLIIASLDISLRFGEQHFQDNRSQEEVSVSRYRKIFTSYSHDDTPIVQALRKAYTVVGDESFLDIEHLRSGQNWNAELLRMIDNADVFQLFWSHRSAHSPYVRQECEYALRHYKYDGFIRPVYWEKPMRPPPPELSHLHFSYYELS